MLIIIYILYTMIVLFFMQKIVMEFIVHVVGPDYFTNPEKYEGERCGGMTFVEPGEVEWYEMVENLEYHGFTRSSSVLYYLDPTSDAPLGLVEISGPTQVQEMLHVHSGTKKCDLYIVVHDSSDGSSSDEVPYTIFPVLNLS